MRITAKHTYYLSVNSGETKKLRQWFVEKKLIEVKSLGFEFQISRLLQALEKKVFERYRRMIVSE